MKLISRADLYKKTNRELAGLRAEFRKAVGNCERQRRAGLAALREIRTVQGQRSKRPGL